jgi:hypothetical protein
MSRIWISYRPADSEPYVRQLRQRLGDHFGQHDILPGDPAVDLDADAMFVLCKILLVVIGPRWAADGSRRRYLDDPQDMVRMMVALCCVDNVSIVPILVNGAVLPGLAELPHDMAKMAECKPVILRDQNLAYDVDTLITRLEVLLSGTQQNASDTETLIKRFAGKYRRQDIRYLHAETLWLDTTLSITDRRLVFQSHQLMGAQLWFLHRQPQQPPSEIALNDIVHIGDAQDNGVQIVTNTGSEHLFIPFGNARRDVISTLRNLIKNDFV